MTASLLREAAALMRERAEGATPGGPCWETAPDEMHGPSQAVIFPADSDSAVAFAGSDDAEHIASWHPAVALAVAGWLDTFADCVVDDPDLAETYMAETASALAVATAYLGQTS